MTATVKKLGSSGAAFDYYSERDDYYMSDHTSAEWYGHGAAALGLTGDINPRDFKHALDGRIGAAQVAKEGHAHTPGWDMTFSAPKSVSVAALVNKDERLTAAHDRAVRIALDHLEHVAAVTRQRDGSGHYAWHDTGNLVIAAVRHSTSRNMDPQLHTHSVVANLTRDPLTGEWRSLDSRAGLYQAQREANNIYMGELARGARAAGYRVEWHVDERGTVSFELTEIPDAELREFSSRRKEIEAELVAKGMDPAAAGARAKQMATLATRSPKEHLPGAELHRRWEAQARAAGFGVGARPEAARPLTGAERSAAAADAVTQAMESISERETRFTERQLLAEATTYAQGRASQSGLAAAVAAARASGDLIDRDVRVRGHSGDFENAPGYTTRAGAAIEESMLSRAGNLAGKPAHVVLTPESINKIIAAREEANGHPFTQEQREAVNAILSGSDGGFGIVQGYAGTAKTTSVHAAVADAARAANIRVRAIAPTHSAANTLAQTLGTDYQTVAAINSGMLDRDGRKELWIVDEAGMVSAKDMRDLLRKADLADAQVILSGDVRQIGSVGAGAALGQLEVAYRDHAHGLTDIKRQTNAELKQAVYDSLRGRFDDALAAVDTQEIVNRDEAVDAIADRYMQDTHAGKSALVVTLSNADRRDVNAAIQRRRMAAGAVRDLHDVVTLTQAGKTGPEMRDAARYQRGEILESLRDFHSGPRRGERLTVARTDGKHVTVARADGSEWTFDPKRTNKLQSLEAAPNRIGAGDRIVARGSINAHDASDPVQSVPIKNGTLLTATGFDPEGRLRARTGRGREVLIDTNGGVKADLAYAQTANSAQGRTVDTAIAWMRSNQLNLADRQHGYVALSRARSHATVITDSKERLAETLAKSARGKQTAALAGREHAAKVVDQLARNGAPTAKLPDPKTVRVVPAAPDGVAADRALQQPHRKAVAVALATGTGRAVSAAAKKYGRAQLTGVVQAGKSAGRSLKRDLRATARGLGRDLRNAHYHFGRDVAWASRQGPVLFAGGLGAAAIMGGARLTVTAAKLSARLGIAALKASTKAAWKLGGAQLKGLWRASKAMGYHGLAALEKAGAAAGTDRGLRLAQYARDVRHSIDQRQQAREWAYLVHGGDRALDKIDRNAARSEKDIRKHTGANPDISGFGKLFESERAKAGREAIAKVREGRSRARQSIMASLNASLDRHSAREAREQGISIYDARQRVADRVYAQRRADAPATLKDVGVAAVNGATAARDALEAAIDRLRHAGQQSQPAPERDGEREMDLG